MIVGYTVSSAVLIVATLARAGRVAPEIDYRGVLWFAAVGICNGLAVLTMYAALGRGAVGIVSPLVASLPSGNPPIEPDFSQGGACCPAALAAGVAGAVGGVVLLIVA